MPFFCCGLILLECVVAGFYVKNRMELAGDLKRKFLLQHSSVDIWLVLNLCFDPRFRLICYPFRHYMHRIYMEGKTFALPIFFFIAILESDYKRTRSVCRPTALPSNLENEAQQLYSKNLQKVYQKHIFKSRQRHYVHKLPTKICIAIEQQELLYTKDTNTYSSNDL